MLRKARPKSFPKRHVAFHVHCIWNLGTWKVKPSGRSAGTQTLSALPMPMQVRSDQSERPDCHVDTRYRPHKNACFYIRHPSGEHLFSDICNEALLERFTLDVEFHSWVSRRPPKLLCTFCATCRSTTARTRHIKLCSRTGSPVPQGSGSIIMQLGLADVLKTSQMLRQREG